MNIHFVESKRFDMFHYILKFHVKQDHSLVNFQQVNRWNNDPDIDHLGRLFIEESTN